MSSVLFSCFLFKRKFCYNPRIAKSVQVSSAVLDDNVDINLVRHFFSHDAWLVVEDVVQRKKDFDLWICNVCQHELDGDNKYYMYNLV